MDEMINSLKAIAEDMAQHDYHINAGIDRKVSVKAWAKDGAKRAYISINCYTLNGRYKGTYKCGYVDLVTGKYVVGQYDDCNLETREYIGR